MALSAEMRKLDKKWRHPGGAWPKRLEWVQITGLRGWTGQRVDFNFPIVAIVGENGSGKSTVLQAAAAVYKAPTGGKETFASDFFPDTPFEDVSRANIGFSYRQGPNSTSKTVRKPTDRWRGNPDRPERQVSWIDLSRIQPVGARVGYVKLLKGGVTEGAHTAFDADRLSRFSQIMGREYAAAGISLTSADPKRTVAVLSRDSARYSGFHQGTGEIAAAELLASDFPRYGLVLIDEVETSLHPRAQRRLIRDLARVAREQELQIILTTHSPYVLDELPPEGRIYLMNGSAGRTVVTGVSPEFAMTQMDDEKHPECDVYVEDKRAADLISELLVAENRNLRSRAQIIPFGSAEVGKALGQMVKDNRFPRPSLVYLDGDQSAAQGCIMLPGGDAPEIVVFSGLKAKGWPDIARHVWRGAAETIDALEHAMTLEEHHDWLLEAGNSLALGTDQLWQNMCAAWVMHCATQAEKDAVVHPIADALGAPH